MTYATAPLSTPMCQILWLQVVSCEMIEAVGHEHLEAYFRMLGAMAKPGGTVVIQVR